MCLNILFLVEGFKKVGKCLGCGIGFGFGKIGGCGYKGQKFCFGGGVCCGFEGGQMFLYCCLLKFGFIFCKVVIIVEVCLFDLVKVEGGVVDLNMLKVVNIIGIQIEFVKVILVGEVIILVIVCGLCVIKGVCVVIEVVGGKIEE